MAEKPKEPTQLTLDLEETKASTSAKSNTSSYKVVLKDDAAQTPSRPAVRRKPSVNTRSMTVKISSRNKTDSPATKPKSSTQTKQGGVSARTRVQTVRTAEQPNPHLVQTHAVRGKGTPVARPKVQPPPIGKRKGYRKSKAAMLLIPLLAATLLFCIAILWWVISAQRGEYQMVMSPLVEDRPVIALNIERGMTARSVSLLLQQSGVVEDAQALLAYIVENDLATILKTGSYLMNNTMSFEEIGKMLTAAPEMVQLTIPGAFTLETIDAYLVNRLGFEQGTFLQSSHDLATAYGLSFTEGWLLGGTYSVNRQRAANDLALSMHQAMLEEVRKHLSSPLLEHYSIEELLIVASMIQAETQDVSQMPGISSVIHNRLKNNEPLGIDATTRYELNDWVNPIPTHALETKTPYNTRRRVGLPPTGICSPTSDAVQAAFHPADTPYFYYLHDADKQIHFASTYEEHKENIKLYR